MTNLKRDNSREEVLSKSIKIEEKPEKPDNGLNIDPIPLPLRSEPTNDVAPTSNVQIYLALSTADIEATANRLTSRSLDQQPQGPSQLQFWTRDFEKHEHVAYLMDRPLPRSGQYLHGVGREKLVYSEKPHGHRPRSGCCKKNALRALSRPILRTPPSPYPLEISEIEFGDIDTPQNEHPEAFLNLRKTMALWEEHSVPSSPDKQGITISASLSMIQELSLSCIE